MMCVYTIGVIIFRALYLGGYDIVKDHFELHESSLLTRLSAAQVRDCVNYMSDY